MLAAELPFNIEQLEEASDQHEKHAVLAAGGCKVLAGGADKIVYLVPNADAVVKISKDDGYFGDQLGNEIQLWQAVDAETRELMATVYAHGKGWMVQEYVIPVDPDPRARCEIDQEALDDVSGRQEFIRRVRGIFRDLHDGNYGRTKDGTWKVLDWGCGLSSYGDDDEESEESEDSCDCADCKHERGSLVTDCDCTACLELRGITCTDPACHHCRRIDYRTCFCTDCRHEDKFTITDCACYQCREIRHRKMRGDLPYEGIDLERVMAADPTGPRYLTDCRCTYCENERDRAIAVANYVLGRQPVLFEPYRTDYGLSELKAA